MPIAVTVLVGLAGVACVLLTLVSAVKTVVVPRATPVLITLCVFVGLHALSPSRCGAAATTGPEIG
jgi:hypothetical protein